jgi:hypothetical protein
MMHHFPANPITHIGWTCHEQSESQDILVI